MHEIEPAGFCPIREYRQYIEWRKQANELSLGGLYMMIAALRGDIKGKEAFKFPLRMKTIELGEPQSADLTADLLDVDLRPAGVIIFSIQDGISKRPNVIEKSTNQKVEQMYIKDYEDSNPSDPRGISIQEEIAQLQLVGV